MKNILGRFGKKLPKRIYLDYAASTPVDKVVVKAMTPYWSENFGNAGSFHEEGRISKEAIKNARHVCASEITANDEEIIFTGSGTEANTLAIVGMIENLKSKGKKVDEMHLITTSIEHPSVIDVFAKYEKEGASVTYLKVTKDGLVDVKQLHDSLREGTVLVSIMYVNNEVGAIQPIEEIGAKINKFKKEKNSNFPYFHTDASQAGLFIDINVSNLKVDMMTLDAQKMYGPKGVGLLYKKKNVNLDQVIIGGGQEFGLRPGTVNVPLVVGFAKAFQLASRDRKKERERLIKLRDYCIQELKTNIPNIEINGPYGDTIDNRAVNNINISIPGMDSEFLVVSLDVKGVSCGARSACIKGGENKSSYVVEALGKDDLSSSSLRFTLGKFTNKSDIDYMVSELKNIVSSFDTHGK